MSELYTRFDNIFFEKTRLSIVTYLSRYDEMTFNELKERMELSDGALYTHVQKLLKAGYVNKRKELRADNAHTVYTLSLEGEKQFKQYISFLKDMVEEAF